MTRAIEQALDNALAEAKPPQPRKARSIEEMLEATERFRKAVGLDKHKRKVTKADFDALWEIPGVTDPPAPPQPT